MYGSYARHLVLGQKQLVQIWLLPTSCSNSQISRIFVILQGEDSKKFKFINWFIMKKLSLNKVVIARLGNQSVLDNYGLAKVAGGNCMESTIPEFCPETSTEGSNVKSVPPNHSCQDYTCNTFPCPTNTCPTGTACPSVVLCTPTVGCISEGSLKGIDPCNPE